MSDVSDPQAKGVRRLRVFDGGGRPPVHYRVDDHAPVCAWCRWKDSLLSICLSPTNNPANRLSTTFSTSTFNDHRQCESYHPSLLTKVLQAVRFRPFIRGKAKT